MGQTQSNQNEIKYSYDFGYESIKYPISFFQKLFPYEYTYNQIFPNQLRGIINEDEYRSIGDYIKFIAFDGSPHLEHFQTFFIFLEFAILNILVLNKPHPIISYCLFGFFFMLYFVSFLHTIIKIIKIYKEHKKIKEFLGERPIRVGVDLKINRVNGVLVFFLGYANIILLYNNFFYLFDENMKKNKDFDIFYLLFFFINISCSVFFLYIIILFSKYKNLIPSYSKVSEIEHLQMLTKITGKYFDPISQSLFYRDVSQPQLSSPPTQQQESTETQDTNHQYINIDIDVEQTQKLLNNQQ